MSIPRSEHPKPQFRRDTWLCLNGEWEFEIDNAKVGEEKDYQNRSSLEGKINVPFAPESELSGIGNTDFMFVVWYRKEVTLPESMKGKRVFLHFGAVDHEANRVRKRQTGCLSHGRLRLRSAWKSPNSATTSR